MPHLVLRGHNFVKFISHLYIKRMRVDVPGDKKVDENLDFLIDISAKAKRS